MFVVHGEKQHERGSKPQSRLQQRSEIQTLACSSIKKQDRHRKKNEKRPHHQKRAANVTPSFNKKTAAAKGASASK